jgi:hypothetical protein
MIQTTDNESATDPPPAGPSTPWLTTAIENVGTSGFDIALERSEANDGSTIDVPEEIGYIALTPTTGSFETNAGTIQFEGQITSQTINGWDNSSGTPSENRMAT